MRPKSILIVSSSINKICYCTCLTDHDKFMTWTLKNMAMCRKFELIGCSSMLDGENVQKG